MLRERFNQSRHPGWKANTATEQQAKRTLERFENALARRPNVVGLGIVPTDENATRGEMAVGVYVTRKQPKHLLSPNERVPEVLEIPGRSGPVTVPTRVIEQREVQLEALGQEPI